MSSIFLPEIFLGNANLICVLWRQIPGLIPLPSWEKITYGFPTLWYIFCSDEKILEVNRQYLQHDYYTDIITFDYCEGDRLSGDLFISLDTIRTNAEQFGTSYENELHRVIIHGILHLCGINDKGPGEREIMEGAENKALSIRKV